MQSSLYVSLSAQVALQNRLETIAQNVANGTSAGYRGSEMKFNAVMAQMSNPQVSFVSSGSGVIKRSSGQFVKTGNPLDVAVKGEGWLAIQTAGGQAYTRDGRMRMGTAGDLVSMTGAPILDAGGAAIQLDPTAGQPHIANDGSITQGQNRVGVLGLFTLPANAQLSRVEGNAFTSNIPGTPIVDSAANGVVQGFSEQSNVNPMTELTRLIYVQRAFDGVSTTLQATESSLKSAIQTLGVS
jgi:flagellar basal-body rod protein FlgF